MTFTDDDLQRLKAFWLHKAPGSSCDCSTYDEAMALIARLEAMERALDCYHDEYGSPIEVAHEYRASRKAAGK